MKGILKRQLTVLKKDESTHKKINITIEDEAERLEIKFRYNPRVTTDENDINNSFKKEICEMTEEERIFLKNRYLNGQEILKNLATLSLYHDGDYIGCGHRGCSEEKIILSKEKSSPGYKKISDIKGKWEMIISLHGINTDIMNISLEAEWM